MKRIIAFVGMPGSGKGTCTEYLEKSGYTVFHFGNIVTQEEIPRRGLELNAANEKIVREDLREKGGKGVLASMVVDKIDQSNKDVIVLDGLYSWTEYRILNEAYGEDLLLIAVYTPKVDRYARLMARDYRPLTKEEATLRDVAEIENLEKGGPIAYADYLLHNTETPESLKSELDNLLLSLGVSK